MSAITRSRPNRRSRRLSGEQRPMQVQIPVEIVSVTADGNNLVVVFNQTVNLTGIPQFLKNGGQAPTGATRTAPNSVTLTYPLGPEATSLTIPPDDRSIRNAAGGFVAATSIEV